LSFFGLQPTDKAALHKSIFSLIQHGNGFTFSDVYSMPVYLRNFYMKELIDLRKEENKAAEAAQKSNSLPTRKFNPR